MIKTLLAVVVGAAFSTNAMADSTAVNGPMAFDPIASSAYVEATSDPAILNSEPWVIPQGYRQSVISDESARQFRRADKWRDQSDSAHR